MRLGAALKGQNPGFVARGPIMTLDGRRTVRSLVVLVDFWVKPAFAERFGELIAANAEASLKRERGCRRFDVLVAPEEPRRFVLYEIYDDDSAFEEHLRSRHYLDFAQAIEGEIEERSIRRLATYAAQPTTGAAG
jgi:(4S)-4-hydroxy-5-phosphonooxypentane-2,3-dione isomerase